MTLQQLLANFLTRGISAPLKTLLHRVYWACMGLRSSFPPRLRPERPGSEPVSLAKTPGGEGI